MGDPAIRASRHHLELELLLTGRKLSSSSEMEKGLGIGLEPMQVDAGQLRASNPPELRFLPIWKWRAFRAEPASRHDDLPSSLGSACPLSDTWVFGSTRTNQGPEVQISFWLMPVTPARSISANGLRTRSRNPRELRGSPLR